MCGNTGTDTRKIEIIAASNNAAYRDECLRYIRQLEVPDGYTLSWTCVEGASSMTAAYNEAMARSDAKYKIYIHHDTFLICPTLLHSLIDIFTEHPDVGMLGVVGGSELRRDGIMWKAWNRGRTRGWNSFSEVDINYQGTATEGLWEVAAIDGMFMATQYDIPWRDDILHGWDFYDVSQSLEFYKHGYRVAVPYQESPWCLHDCGYSKLGRYNENRKIFCEAYAELGFLYREEDLGRSSSQIYEAPAEILRALPGLMEERRFGEALQMIQEAYDAGLRFSESSVARQLMAVWNAEMKAYGREVFWADCADYQALLDRYTEVRFGLHRLEYGIEQQDSLFLQMCAEGRLTAACLDELTDSCVYARQAVREKWWRLIADTGRSAAAGRLLLYSWHANNEEALADALRRTGREVVVYDRPCRHYTRDLELAADMIPYLHAQHVTGVISFNYFPILSMICDTCKIPYYAWVYDCPHFTLYAKQIALPCNHIGIFDREMVRRLREDYGVSTVFHAPLSADADYFAGAAGRQTEPLCDVSFVGSLYTGEHDYYDEVLEETDRRVLDRLIDRQCFCYDTDYLRPALAAGEIDLRAVQTAMEREGLMLGEDYFAKAEDILLAAVLEKKVTVEERRRLLERIAAGGHDFRLYTGSDTAGSAALHSANQGRVDYRTQMPLVFAGSRINLNISLRSIRSGIPLRVLDIMACGGFVLSNRQPELEEYFRDGEELALFGSSDECVEKIEYYLAHEEERRAVAAAGRRRAEELFSYERGLDRLFSS